MDYSLIHKTTYEYSEPVSVSHHTARLVPVNDGRQCTSDFTLEISPRPEAVHSRTDYFGNAVSVFVIRELHRTLEVLASCTVSVPELTPPVPSLSPPWGQVAVRFCDPVSPRDTAPYEFCLDSPLVRPAQSLATWARRSFPGETPLLVGVHDLMGRLYREFEFDPVATDVATPLEEVWEKRRGVCQDFAHVALGCLRSLGLPARYVSGYLRTLPPPGQKRMQGADASHAWFSVFCPLNGWVDFDPTNNLMPAEGHITVAVGRDFSDVSPLIGILTGGGEHSVSVAVDVVPAESTGTRARVLWD
jgi:transglutaminase-like putative cysteine protease